MTVQIIAAPPMHDAMTMITVKVVLVTEDVDDDALLVSADVAVEVSDEDVPVMVRVTFSSGRTVVRTFD